MSQLYVRLPDELHAKLRVVAALKGESLNATMLAASQSYVVDWELKHGELPSLLKKSKNALIYGGIIFGRLVPKAFVQLVRDA